jgi:hypothetical protein
VEKASGTIGTRDIKMLKELIKLANELDTKGLLKEADALDKMIKRAQSAEDKLNAVLDKNKNYKLIDGQLSESLGAKNEADANIKGRASRLHKDIADQGLSVKILKFIKHEGAWWLTAELFSGE